jgi:hypothetical protein
MHYAAEHFAYIEELCLIEEIRTYLLSPASSLQSA